MTLGSLYLEAQGCVPLLLENLHGMFALELVGPWVVLGFSVGMEAFDELLSINVPWIHAQSRRGLKRLSSSSSKLLIVIFQAVV